MHRVERSQNDRSYHLRENGALRDSAQAAIDYICGRRLVKHAACSELTGV